MRPLVVGVLCRPLQVLAMQASTLHSTAVYSTDIYDKALRELGDTVEALFRQLELQAGPGAAQEDTPALPAVGMLRTACR